MTLRHLTIFKYVCDKMSITAAAEVLNMTQPAVSIAIKELEAFYSSRLLDRINRRIYLTESGEMLRQYAETILDRFDESISVLRDESNLITCRIGMNVAAGEEFLPDILEKLGDKMPELRPTVIIGNANMIEEKLVGNEIDFAVADTLTELANCVVYSLCGEEMQAVCSDIVYPDKSITVDCLAKMPLLLREKGSGCRNCVESVFKSHDCKITPFVESASTLSLINLAKKGAGITILPQTLISHINNSSNLHTVSVIDCRFQRHQYLTHLSNKFMSPAIKQSMEVIKEFFRFD